MSTKRKINSTNSTNSLKNSTNSLKNIVSKKLSTLEENIPNLKQQENILRYLKLYNNNISKNYSTKIVTSTNFKETNQNIFNYI